MNNVTTNITTVAIDATIQENYQNLCTCSSTALLLYTVLLNLGQEVEFIWFKPFSLPALLYIFTRYGDLFYMGFDIWLYYLPPSERACTVVNSVVGASETFGFIGIQGLLVARAYSLMGENRILSKIFVFMLLLGIVIQLAVNIMFDGCSVPANGTFTLLILLTNIDVLSMDILVFSICMWKIWGIWRLGRQSGIRGGNSIASILVKQSILRCCFIVVTNVATTIITYRLPKSDLSGCVSLYQNTLSSIMLADFTLELRRQNSASIEAHNISLSSIKFSNVLQNIEQSILVEMATPNPDVEGPNGGNRMADEHHDTITTTASDI